MSTKENTLKDITIEGLRVDIPKTTASTQIQREGETVRCSGVVKWFNPTKGFGFITPEDGGADVFVHQSEIQLGGFRSLAQGELVEYDLLNGEKGPKALSVTGPDGVPPKGAPRQPKVMFIDGDHKTFYAAASKNKEMQSLLVGNHVPVYTSLNSTIPYATSNQYVKRNVQYSPLSPKQIGFVHSPVATTHSSFHFYSSPRDYPVSNAWPPTTPPGKKETDHIVDPNSPQFHYPVTQNSGIPLSPTFTGYSGAFSYPLSSPTPQYSTTPNATTASSHYYPESLISGIGDMNLGYEATASAV